MLKADIGKDSEPNENEKYIKNGQEKNEPEKGQEGVTKEELIEQLESQVRYFDKFPQHEKFAFAVNADLYYFMLIILNILKKG